MNKDETHCRRCGQVRPSDSPSGLCPSCLLRAGLDVADTGPHEETATLETLPPGALEELADTMGETPLILLQDTDPEIGPSPLILTTSAELPVGDERAGRLQLFGEIARGGMGAVIKGRDPDLGRYVAVKVLLESHRNNPELVRRFVEKAQIGGQLQHPGIVPIYQLGVLADRRPYFAMKLVKGRTLSSLLDERPDPGEGLSKFLTIFEAVCQTMAYAHARGVMHRDLKPSNVMVGAFGEVQVMDWGLARVLHQGGAADDASAGRTQEPRTIIATARSGTESDLSLAGSVLGTPSYMAPEQARGEIDRLDQRCDVFALGSILCEILTGAPAFTGPSPGEIQRLSARGDLSAALDRLHRCGADAELINLAESCLSPEPEDRPRHAGNLADGLAAYRGGVQDRLRRAEIARAEEMARAEEATRRAVVERDRRRLALALAAAIILMVASGGGAAAWYARERQARLDRVERLIDLATAAIDRAEQEGGWLESARWEEARVCLGQAEEVAGQRPDAVTTTRLGSLRARADRALQIRTLLTELESIRGDRGEHLDPARAERAYAEAFRGFGINPDHGGVVTAVAPTGSQASVEIAGALDDWAEVRRELLGGRDDPSWRRLLEAARAADPDPWRTVLRSHLQRPRDEAVEAMRGLADDPGALGQQPAPGLVLLARTLRRAGDRDRAATVLHAAWRRSPGDYWVNLELGISSWDAVHRRFEQEDASRFLTAAVAIRPGSFVAHDSLGVALRGQGDLEGAIAAFRQALRLKPDDPVAHYNLGVTMQDKGYSGPAIIHYREAIRLKVDYFVAHNNLGVALRGQGDLEGAIAAFRQALRLKPDGRAAPYGHVVPHNPTEKGQESNPITGAVDESTVLAYGVRLPAVLSGAEQPKEVADYLPLARVAARRDLHAAAVRFYFAAFDAQPKLADDLSAQARYGAAVSAAQAGCGLSADDPPLGDGERGALRSQALEWLTEELAGWTQRLESDPRTSRGPVERTLNQWRRSSSLSCVRDEVGLNKLPEDERREWQAFWSEVDGLLMLTRAEQP
jgi:serine/threonine-protein kinase